MTKNDLSILSVLKHSSRFSLVNVARFLLQVPVSLFQAHFLGPAILGEVGIANLWVRYAGLIGPGLDSAVSREMADLKGQGKEDEAVQVQNAAYTGEILWSLVVTAAIILLGFAYDRPLVRYGLFISASVFLSSKIYSFYSTTYYAFHFFPTVARAQAINVLSQPLLLLGLLFVIGGYAPYVAPLLAVWLTLLWVKWRGERLNFLWRWDSQEAWRLMKVGLVLQCLAFAYWGFRLADRTIIAIMDTSTALGHYNFAMVLIEVGALVISDYGRVIQPKIYSALGGSKNARAISTTCIRLSLFGVFGACAAAGLCQACMGPLVLMYLPAYETSISVFEQLTPYLAIHAAALLPGILLTSVAINRQNMIAIVWAAGAMANLALDYLAIQAGWGIEGVAVMTVTTFFLVVLVTWKLALPHLFKSTEDCACVLLAQLAMIGTLVVMNIAFCQWPILALERDSHWANLCQRGGTALLLWVTVGSLLLWWSKMRHTVSLGEGGDDRTQA